MPYRIAGIDVHKAMLAVVVAAVEVEGDWPFVRRRFGATPSQLRLLTEWFGRGPPGCGDAGWPLTMAAIKDVSFLPSNARVPVVISQRSAPNAKRAVRRPTEHVTQAAEVSQDAGCVVSTPARGPIDRV